MVLTAQNTLSSADRGSADVTARVWIVEDEAMVATDIADVVADAGFAVSGVASSGAEALLIAAEEGADLALVDIKLAGPMDGIEVARELRSRNGIGTIFLSGTDDPAVIQRAEIAAPLGFLQKPFLPSQEFNAMNRALKRAARY